MNEIKTAKTINSSSKTEKEEILELEKERILPYRLKTTQKIYIIFKNVIDWWIAFFVIIVFSPIWLILAISIKIDSKGPAIFKHNRIGKKGKLFKCWKWRSMMITAPKHKASCEFDDAEVYITKVGNFIRKTSLDEFAQFFNVLQGKMSLIGYRPLVENETEIDNLRKQNGIYQLKPGISGWAQVNGRDLVTPKHKVELDTYYLQHISLWLDIKIIFITIKKIFQKEGIKEGKIEEFEANPPSRKKEPVR